MVEPANDPPAVLPPALRATFYIDGFNLYHGIKEDSKAREYKWLNLWSLAESRLMPGHELKRVLYFTSLPDWNQGKRRRHESYMAALRSVGVEVVLSRFQRDEQLCYGHCGQLFYKYVEKMTDVRIATTMIRDAVLDQTDWVYLVSGDADQVPAIHILREVAPTKRVRVIFPPRRHTAELENVADAFTSLTHKILKHHLLPDQITAGRHIIQKPATW
jgi:uncharacterized LabA/DUF88 family protein